MKFRVETWDTTEWCGAWYIAEEGNAFSPWSHWDRVRQMHPPSTKVRLWIKHNWSWLLIGENYGTKETKPMSTKQRGDVEKITPKDKYRIHNFPGSHYEFDRDEFRRIWEAGNREFEWENAVPIKDENLELRRSLAEKDAEIARLEGTLKLARMGLADMIREKDAEIARLKAQVGLHHVGPCSQYAEEIARLRGWLNEIDKIVNLRGEVERSVARALAGEAVPE